MEGPAQRLAVGRPVLVALGIFGTALLYGDGMITPAISVLSAVEGLQVATPLFSEYVVPITVAFSSALFVIQQFGTHRVGRLFGPIVIIWFLTIAILGVAWIVRGAGRARGIRSALRVRLLPAERFSGVRRPRGGLSRGHRRRSDVRRHGPLREAPDSRGLVRARAARAGAQLSRPGRAPAAERPGSQPFFLLAPQWALVPLVALATAAAIIASQALISGGVLNHATSHPVGPRSASRHRAHLVERNGPDLYSAGELGADGRAPSSL